VIPHNRPTLGLDEALAARRVIESGWLAQGSEVAAFENEMCMHLGLPEGHAVALSSGTAALFMALWALGVNGHKVAIPVYSCAALRNAVLMAGGIPVAVDVAEGTPNIDLTAAVMGGAQLAVAAHMFGMPLSWCEADTPIPVIEDCAQALGTRICGRPAGLSGKVGVFSFYATKMITSGGQGGMLVSKDLSLVEAVRDYREFDCRDDRKPRFNFQMTDLQAAVGRAQLSRLEAFVDLRREHYERFSAAGLPLWRAGAAADVNRYRVLLDVANPRKIVVTMKQYGVRAILPVKDWELLDTPENYPRALSLTR